MRTNTQPPRLKPFKSAALSRGIPYCTARDIANRGELPIVRLGRAWYIDEQDLDDWIRRQKKQRA
jgi:excisionase family DNA binding protein